MVWFGFGLEVWFAGNSGIAHGAVALDEKAVPSDLGGITPVVIGDVGQLALALELEGDQVIEVLHRPGGVPEALCGSGDNHAHLARLVGQGSAARDVVDDVGDGGGHDLGELWVYFSIRSAMVQVPIEVLVGFASDVGSV